MKKYIKHITLAVSCITCISVLSILCKKDKLDLELGDVEVKVFEYSDLKETLKDTLGVFEENTNFILNERVRDSARESILINSSGAIFTVFGLLNVLAGNYKTSAALTSVGIGLCALSICKLKPLYFSKVIFVKE